MGLQRDKVSQAMGVEKRHNQLCLVEGQDRRSLESLIPKQLYFSVPQVALASLHVYLALEYETFQHGHRLLSLCITIPKHRAKHIKYTQYLLCKKKKNPGHTLCGCQKESTDRWIYQFGLSHSHLQEKREKKSFLIQNLIRCKGRMDYLFYS